MATTSKLFRDEVQYVDGSPFRRLVMYQIDADASYGSIDLLDIGTDFYISSITATCLDPLGFQENAAYALYDTSENAVLGVVQVRAGRTGLLTIDSPAYNPALKGPTKLRVTHIDGIPGAGQIRYEVSMLGPVRVEDDGQSDPIGEVIVPLPGLTGLGTIDDFQAGYAEGNIGFDDHPTMFRALGRILAGRLKSISDDAAFMAQSVAAQITGGAPDYADTLNELLQMVQALSAGAGVQVVPTAAELDSVTNPRVGTLVLAADNGDGKSALYYVASVEPLTFQVIADPDTATLSALQVKELYESNSDTNALTDALLAKLEGAVHRGAAGPEQPHRDAADLLDRGPRGGPGVLRDPRGTDDGAGGRGPVRRRLPRPAGYGR